jgi:hypothetical protein
MVILIAAICVGFAVFAAATAVGLQYGLSTSAAVAWGMVACAVGVWVTLAGIGTE